MTENIKKLILNAQEGDSHAFHQLVAEHDNRVMILAYQLMNNEQDAEDLYQEVFVKVYKQLHAFRFESSFYTWLYRITVNTALNMKKKLGKYKLQEPVNEYNPLENIADSPVENPTEDILASVKTAANSLPEKQRTVFILKHLQNMKIKDIARIMGIGEGTVKKYLFRAIRKLRTELKEYRYV